MRRLILILAMSLTLCSINQRNNYRPLEASSIGEAALKGNTNSLLTVLFDNPQTIFTIFY